MSANTLKPFIKWVGGKTQLLDKIVPMIPEDTDVYIELFLGGGALLLNQLEHNDNIKTFVANDLNVNLIDTYECIKYSHSFILLKARKLPYQAFLFTNFPSRISGFVPLHPQRPVRSRRR